MFSRPNGETCPFHGQWGETKYNTTFNGCRFCILFVTYFSACCRLIKGITSHVRQQSCKQTLVNLEPTKSFSYMGSFSTKLPLKPKSLRWGWNGIFSSPDPKYDKHPIYVACIYLAINSVNMPSFKTQTGT